MLHNDFAISISFHRFHLRLININSALKLSPLDSFSLLLFSRSLFLSYTHQQSLRSKLSLSMHLLLINIHTYIRPIHNFSHVDAPKFQSLTINLCMSTIHYIKFVRVVLSLMNGSTISSSQ